MYELHFDSSPTRQDADTEQTLHIDIMHVSEQQITTNKSPRAQRRSPGYKVQIFNKIFKALSLTVAE